MFARAHGPSIPGLVKKRPDWGRPQPPGPASGEAVRVPAPGCGSASRAANGKPREASDLRVLAAVQDADPRLNDLAGELSGRSERFRQLWAKQDVRGKMSGTSRMQHPVAGLLELRSEKFVVTGADRQLMVVYHADPGTRSYEALQELASQAGQARSLWPN